MKNKTMSKSNEAKIINVIKDKEFMSILNVNYNDIKKAIKMGIKEFKELESIVSIAFKNNVNFIDLCENLKGHNETFNESYPNYNYFDLNYKSLLVTIMEFLDENNNSIGFNVSKSDVYIYPDNISNIATDEMFTLNLDEIIDFNYIENILKEGEIMGETYSEMKKRQSDEVNKFPIKFAFSNEQFKIAMQELGLNENDTDKVTSIGFGGGFIRKDDIPKYKEMFKRHNKELKDAINSDKTGEGFIKEMFRDELNNHEYYITRDYEETFDALGLTMEDIYNNKNLQNGLEIATKEYLDACNSIIDETENEEEAET